MAVDRQELIAKTEHDMAYIEVTCFRCSGKGKVLREPPTVEFIDCPKCDGTGKRSVLRKGEFRSAEEIAEFFQMEKKEAEKTGKVIWVNQQTVKK
jgi:hypothetical protein